MIIEITLDHTMIGDSFIGEFMIIKNHTGPPLVHIIHPAKIECHTGRKVIFLFYGRYIINSIKGKAQFFCIFFNSFGVSFNNYAAFGKCLPLQFKRFKAPVYLHSFLKHTVKSLCSVIHSISEDVIFRAWSVKNFSWSKLSAFNPGHILRKNGWTINTIGWNTH